MAEQEICQCTCAGRNHGLMRKDCSCFERGYSTALEDTQQRIEQQLRYAQADAAAAWRLAVELTQQAFDHYVALRDLEHARGHNEENAQAERETVT